MIRFLDPKNDIAFRKVFGADAELCKSLLNSILPFSKGEEIEELVFVSDECLENPWLYYFTVVHAKCIDKKGREFRVQLMPCFDYLFEYRFLHKIMKPWGEGTMASTNYIVPIVFEMFPVEPEENLQYIFLNSVCEDELSSEIKTDTMMVMVDTKRFKKALGTKREKWISFLKYMKESNLQKEIDPELLEDEHISKALEMLKVQYCTDDEGRRYFHYWDYLENERNIARAYIEKAHRTM